jgi:tetratricopeptide (TPR) repeat protein
MNGGRPINAEDGYHVWSQRYDRELTDVFAVQDDIAAAIAAALQVTLSGSAAGLPERPSLPAYEVYLKGLHFLRQHSADSMHRSRELFEHSIALVPGYAAAHVALARCFIAMGTEGVRPPRDVMPAGRVEAMKALTLNPSDIDAHAVLGSVALTFDYNASEAERLWGLVCDRPDSDMAVWFGVGYLATRHRVGDVIGLLDRALQRDPLNGLFRCILGYFLEWEGMHDRAFAEARRCIELDQNYWGGHFIATTVYTAKGLLADALASAETAYRVAPWHTRIVGQLAGVLARRGQRERSDGLLRQMRAAEVALAFR